MNNDKALAAFKRVKVFADESTKNISPFMIDAKKKLDADMDIIEQALTPQSSADLGRVREKLNEIIADQEERGLKRRASLITLFAAKDARAILDQQAVPETVSREEFEAVCTDLDRAHRTLNEYANQPDVLASLRAKVERLKVEYDEPDIVVDGSGEMIADAVNDAITEVLRLLDEVVGV